LIIMLPVSTQDYVDILRELLTEGFTAVKFFKKTHFAYSTRTDAEKVLRQALAQASRTEKFWDSLRTKEEKDRTYRQEELILEKKKQKFIHVQSNVIDEHLHISDESKMEFTKSTMEVSNYNKADIIGYKQHTNTPKKRSFKEVPNVHETSSGDYTEEGEEDENHSDDSEEDDENRMTQEKKEQFRKIFQEIPTEAKLVLSSKTVV
ncbi:202_t:CDS:2, partial [Funneliformis geosporum]